ncbi:hypothetical protein RIF29_25975 [Crotalaria pallida]|uniref:Uncharacterized protein n=1 Tax=Crotalaria pallida TaxID=3830 RepID=A0AAN9ES81_CROPI
MGLNDATEMAFNVRVCMHPMEDGDSDFLEKGWKWQGDVSLEIDDPLFTLMGINMWDMMDRITLEDPEYAKVLVLPEN